MIDAHAHLHFPEFDLDRDEVVRRAKEAGVEKIITIGTDIEESKKAVACAEWYPLVYASVGIHPHEFFGDGDCSEEEVNGFVSELRKKADHPKVVAIGECGLDYFSRNPEHPVHESEQDRQRKVFRKQLELAKELELPVIVHCREAYADLAALLREYPEHTDIVVHCHEGSVSETEALLELGCIFSFTGNVTYKERKGADRDAMLRMVPIDRILTETDSPYLAPVPHRGDRNEPAYVSLVLEKIAEIKGVSKEKLEQDVEETAKKVFKKMEI